ncbi:MAG: hypothetical protein A2X57_11075 [Nitrospirae bacterium GWD2_57_8]|nr:MAG: hypothetical protein A2X57_11075 [Nitrospirae bacterium GWD2_57_8]
MVLSSLPVDRSQIFNPFPPVMPYNPSCEKATLTWPIIPPGALKVLTAAAEVRSHRVAVSFMFPESANRMSGERATDNTIGADCFSSMDMSELFRCSSGVAMQAGRKSRNMADIIFNSLRIVSSSR